MGALSHRIYCWLARASPLIVLILAVGWCALASARPGGGSSFSGGSGGGSGGGGGDDFVISCVLLLIEVAIDYPQIGLPVLGGVILLLVVMKLAQSDAGKVVLALAVLGGLVTLCIVRPHLGLGIVGAVVILFVIFLLIGRYAGKPEEWSTHIDHPIAATTAPSVARAVLESVRSVDGDFSLVVLEDFLEALYGEVERTRGAGELERLSPYVSAQARAALVDAKLAEVKDVIVGAMRIAKAERGEQIAIVVEFETNLTEVPKKGEAKSYYLKQRWRLERRAEAHSRAPDKARIFCCPSCGAALDAIAGGRCSFCKQLVDTGEHDWLLQSVETLARETKGPLLTEQAPERGTDLPTVVDADVQTKLAALIEKDPAFSEDALAKRVQVMFDTMQVAWSTRDWLKVRPYLSDRLFQAQSYWVDAYRRARLRNVNEQTKIEKVELVRVTSDKYFDSVTVRLYAHGLDYTVSDDGQLVCGSKSEPRRYSEYWTLIRGAAAKGVPRSEPKCPNCGAELKINMAGNCEFCQARVTRGEFDWVLSRIEQDEVYEA